MAVAAYGLGLLALLLFLGLFPPTAPWSGRFLTPLTALVGGGILLGRKEVAFGMGLLFGGLGNLAWTLEELAGWPRGLLLEFPYFIGYASLTLALLRVPGTSPHLRDCCKSPQYWKGDVYT